MQKLVGLVDETPVTSPGNASIGREGLVSIYHGGRAGPQVLLEPRPGAGPEAGSVLLRCSLQLAMRGEHQFLRLLEGDNGFNEWRYALLCIRCPHSVLTDNPSRAAAASSAATSPSRHCRPVSSLTASETG